MPISSRFFGLTFTILFLHVPHRRGVSQHQYRFTTAWDLIDDFQDQPAPASKIQVCVRKRPMSRSERESDVDIASVIPGKQTIIIHEPKIKVDLTRYVEDHEFVFNEVYTVSDTNEDVSLSSPGTNCTCCTR